MPLWLLKLLLPLAGVGLIVGGVFAFKAWVHDVEATAALHQKNLDREEVRAAQAEAGMAAQAAARATEAGRAQGTKEANDALLPQLSAANDRATDYLKRLRGFLAQAPSGSPSEAHLPSAAGGANVPDSTDRLSLLDDDIRKCTAIAVRLGNAQDWWIKLPTLPAIAESPPEEGRGALVSTPRP